MKYLYKIENISYKKFKKYLNLPCLPPECLILTAPIHPIDKIQAANTNTRERHIVKFENELTTHEQKIKIH